MRKLDSDTKRIIEFYKCSKEVEINNLIIKRKEQLKNYIEEYVKEQERLYLNYDKAIKNINHQFDEAVKIRYYFEISNYDSEYRPLYEKDKILKDLQKELNEIMNERKNITLALQFADSKSKEYKEALKKLREE